MVEIFEPKTNVPKFDCFRPKSTIAVPEETNAEKNSERKPRSRGKDEMHEKDHKRRYMNDSDLRARMLEHPSLAGTLRASFRIFSNFALKTLSSLIYSHMPMKSLTSSLGSAADNGSFPIRGLMAVVMSTIVFIFCVNLSNEAQSSFLKSHECECHLQNLKQSYSKQLKGRAMENILI